MTAEQTRNDLRTAASFIRFSLDFPRGGLALADRLDVLADTIEQRDALIEAAEKWRARERKAWYGVDGVDHAMAVAALDALARAVDALRAARESQAAGPAPRVPPDSRQTFDAGAPWVGMRFVWDDATEWGPCEVVTVHPTGNAFWCSTGGTGIAHSTCTAAYFADFARPVTADPTGIQ